MSRWWDRADAQLCGVCGHPNDRSVARNVCPACKPVRDRHTRRIVTVALMLIAVGLVLQVVSLAARALS